MKRYLATTTLLLTVGLLAGFVITAKLQQTSPSDAGQQQMQPARPGTAMAVGAGLPDLSAIAEQAVKSSANISSTQVIRQRADPFMDFFFSGGRQFTQREAQSLGSGVVVSSDGYILTNAHVLLGDGGDIREVKVTLPADRSEYPAKIVGLDSISDLAVLKVDAKGLQTLPWGDSDKVRIAEWVLAIGNPFEFNQTVTLGIVSAKGRTGAQIGAYGQMIQTDAAINPGNSGGALINARGELIGINSMIYSRGGGSEGLGFAIPSNLAQKIMTELRENGTVAWGSIDGVDFEDVGVNPRNAREFGITSPSVIVAYNIVATSGAARAGLQRGDVLLSFNNSPVTTTNDLQRLVVDAKPGTMATLEVLRGRDRIKITVPITSSAKSR